MVPSRDEPYYNTIKFIFLVLNVFGNPIDDTIKYLKLYKDLS